MEHDVYPLRMNVVSKRGASSIVRKKTLLSKFRLYIRWKFPLLFECLGVLKFPLQVVFVGLLMVVAVKFYDSQFSHKASMKRFNRTASVANSQADPAAADAATAKTAPVDVTPLKPLSTDNSPPVNAVLVSTVSGGGDPLLVNPDTLETGLATATESPTVDVANTIVTTASVTATKVSLPLASQAADSAGTLNASTDEVASDPELHQAEWISQQPANHYVVQIAAATKQELLLRHAAANAFKPLLAIYPFKVNKDGELVYGISTGLFIVRADAMTELPIIREKSSEHGVWVRKVADIQKEMATLKRFKLIP